ncbi:MAG: hypothetical protein IH986_10955 [Planctomycetes bacterium]|nr:hypothetical protein [Planctomycetota bacterium]
MAHSKERNVQSQERTAHSKERTADSSESATHPEAAIVHSQARLVYFRDCVGSAETAPNLARDACAITHNANPPFLDTLALAQHLTGDTPAAVETEKKALSLLPPNTPGRGRGDYEAALAKFEAALKKAETAEEPGGG